MATTLLAASLAGTLLALAPPPASLPDLRVLWDFTDPAASEAAFRQVLEERPGLAPHDRAVVLTQVARAQGLQEEYDAAHATLDRAAALLGGARTNEAGVRLLLERGRVHNSSGAPASAHPLFRDALVLAREVRRDGLAVDAAHMLGIVAPGTDAQVRWNRAALWMIGHSTQEAAKRWEGSVLNNLGWSLHDGGRPEEALEVFRRAWDVRRAADPTAESTRIAKWCVARALRTLERYEEALALQEELAAEFAALGREDRYVTEELGHLREALGRGA